jgi:hypothetical protein
MHDGEDHDSAWLDTIEHDVRETTNEMDANIRTFDSLMNARRLADRVDSFCNPIQKSLAKPPGADARTSRVRRPDRPWPLEV